MGKFRRVLVLVFGALSIVFALIAFVNGFGDKSPKASDKILCAPWGKSIETQARAENRLVLFTVGETSLHLGKDAGECVNKYYILSKLCPERFPADYYILKRILSRAAGKAKNIEAGILSPKMRPVYITSKIGIKSASAPFESIIMASAAMHVKYNSSKNCASNIVPEKGELRFSYSPLLNDITPIPFFIEAHSWAILTMFEREKTLPAAILSENSRLAVKIAVGFPRHTCAKRTSDVAVKRLLAQLSIKSQKSVERLLCLRALGEISAETQSKKLMASSIALADSVLKNQNSIGLFSFSNGTQNLVENALAVSFLSSVAKFAKNDKYILAAKKCADVLNAFLEERGVMPAILARSIDESQASAYGYAFLAKAFADLHHTTADRKFIDCAIKTIGELNRFYSTRSGLWAINSENSVLANFSRPILGEDGELPSYIGEGAQTCAYIEKTLSRPVFDNSEILRRVSESGFHMLPIKSLRAASLKLACFQ